MLSLQQTFAWHECKCNSDLYLFRYYGELCLTFGSAAFHPFYFLTKRRGGQVPPRDVEAIQEEEKTKKKERRRKKKKTPLFLAAVVFVLNGRCTCIATVHRQQSSGRFKPTVMPQL